MSLTDGGIQPTMPVTPTGVNNGGWGGFGGDGWWIILFFIVLFGWGGNGFGGSRGGVTDGYILTSDFANVERKLDGVNNGLCDGFFAQAQLINGVQQNLSNGFMSAELSRANPAVRPHGAALPDADAVAGVLLRESRRRCAGAL